MFHSPKGIFHGYELEIPISPLGSAQLKQILNKKWDLGEMDRFLLFLQRCRDSEKQTPSPSLPA